MDRTPDVFDDFADALNYANACVRSPGLVKRRVALLATPIADYFSHLNDRYRAGQHAVISLIAEESEGVCASLLQRHRGANAIRRASDEARARNSSLMEYCWNHTTLHALKVDNTLTYLQTAFDPQRYPQQILQMEQHFAGRLCPILNFCAISKATSPPAVCSWCAIPRPNVSTRSCRYFAITTSKLTTPRAAG